MLVKNISIEVGRRNPYPIIVGLHPGTVKSQLSSPFTSATSENKIFTADFAVTKMSKVLLNLKKEDSGKLFSWNGKQIEF